MAKVARAWIALTGCLVLGCDGRHENPQSPTSPAPLPSPPAATPTGSDLEWGEVWDLTVVHQGVAGNPCLRGPAVGAGRSWDLAVARSGSAAVGFAYGSGDPLDDFPVYLGTQQEGEFTARSSPIPTGFPECGEGTFEGRLAGRFSEDGRHLEATEVWSYSFQSGVGELTFTWSAECRLVRGGACDRQGFAGRVAHPGRNGR